MLGKEWSHNTVLGVQVLHARPPVGKGVWCVHMAQARLPEYAMVELASVLRQFAVFLRLPSLGLSVLNSWDCEQEPPCPVGLYAILFYIFQGL